MIEDQGHSCLHSEFKANLVTETARKKRGRKRKEKEREEGRKRGEGGKLPMMGWANEG